MLHKTARLTIQAMEDKTTAERSREKQLEWYGKMLEVALVYGKGDRPAEKADGRGGLSACWKKGSVLLPTECRMGVTG